MLKSIRRLLAPPVFEHEEQNRVAWLLTRLLQIMSVTFTVVLVASEIVEPSPEFTYPVLAVSTASFLTIYVLVRRGRLRLAGTLFIAFLWVLFTVVTGLFEGVLGYFLAGYILCIILAGSIFGRTGILAMTGVSVFSALGLFLAETTQLIHPALYASSQLIDWVDWSFLFGLVSIFVLSNEEHLRTALSNARRNEQIQLKANQELMALRDSLEDQVRERAAQLNVSAEVSRAVTSILDQNVLIQQVVGLIADRFDFYYAAIFLVDEANEFAVLHAATDTAGQSLKKRGYKLQISGHSMVGAAIRTRKPRVALDVDKEAMRFANPLLTETRSEIALPLVVGDRVVGALDVQSTLHDAFDQDTVIVLQGLTDQIAIALNNAQQFQNAQAEARQATALFEASQAASGVGEDLSSTLHRLFEVVAPRADFETLSAARYSATDQAYTVLATYHTDEAQSIEDTGQIVRLEENFDTPVTLAIQTQELVIANAAQTDPRFEALTAQQRSVLGKLISVPVLLGTRLLGVVTLARSQHKPDIGPRDIQIAKAIANQVTLSIENHRLLEEAQAAAANLDQMMRLYTHQGWAQFTQAQPTASLQHEYSQPNAPLLPPDVLAQIEQSALSRQAGPITFDGQMAVGIPIALRGEMLGTLGLQLEADRPWTEDELATVQAVADQVAQSLEAARLLEESETSLEETTALYRASRGIAAAQTPHEILRAIAESIIAPEVDRLVLVLIDPDSPPDNPLVEVTAAWDRGQAESPVAGTRWDATGIPLIRRPLVEPLVVPDVANSPRLDPVSRRVFLNVIGAKAVVVVPLMVGGRSLGWLLIESLSGPYVFAEQEIRRYRTLAGQATVALENRRLFEDIQARVGELTVLTRIGRRLASTLELNEVLALIVDEAIGATTATHASIALYNELEQALEMKMMRGYPAEVEASILNTFFRPGLGLHGRVLTTGESVLANDVRLDPDYYDLSIDTLSEYVVPIRQGDLLLGALNLESPKLNGFRDSDVRLIEALADQAAIAITNARSYEAEREAVERMREVDRLKTQFLANMSHELRTPLNSIIGFSRVILRGIDGPLTELQKTDLQAIYGSGQHLLSLINNILDLSKIEAGKMELSLEPIDLHEIVRSVMSTAIALVKDKTVTLEQEVPDHLPEIQADQTRVRQIILNLVSNAAKFTAQGKITLRVVVNPQEIQISVTDSGIGIAPDNLESIFEEFTQVDASTTRRVGGTGLGLAITRRFVEMHGGRIWVESQLDAGSTFTFTLPLERKPEEPAVTLPTDLAARDAGKKVILSIDDDPGVITLYKRYLEKQGYIVIGLTDPTKAVEEAKRLLPFAITLDVLMPNRDGWSVLADLKSAPEVNRTPIVMCSIIQDKTKGFTLGAAEYLIKPITEDELLRALARLERHKSIHKILVVDDEPDAIQLIRRILEAQAGYVVLEAGGGAQGITTIQSEQPDLVILDLMMPDIDGFAVLENIKSNGVTSNIPVIVVTAKELAEEDRQRLKGNTTALFNKGMFTAEQLLKDIAEALKAMNGATVSQAEGPLQHGA